MTDINETPAQPAAEAVEPEKVESTPTPEPAPVAVPEPAPVAVEKPAEEPKPVPAANPAVPARHVVTAAKADPVHLSACVYLNKYNKKSLTVHHLQRRLVELGYNDAVGDKDGWYGELTHKSVADYQKANRLEATGLMDAKTFAAIFNGDSNVEVVID
jgi:peptidoglycan hydrolase-like protein with peptidoglycan-binding domain